MGSSAQRSPLAIDSSGGRQGRVHCCAGVGAEPPLRAVDRPSHGVTFRVQLHPADWVGHPDAAGPRGLHGYRLDRLTDRLPVRLLKVGDVCWGVRQFTIQRLAVGDASAQELGPRWHSNIAIDLLGKRSPQVRMMPTKVVTGAVAVLTYRCAQLHHFDDELLAGHRRQVIIHHAVSIPTVDAAVDSISPRLGRWGPVSDGQADLHQSRA